MEQISGPCVYKKDDKYTMKGFDAVKKILTLILCLILLVTTGMIAAAAPESPDGAMDARLKAITLSVKETLGIGDTFTTFDGTLNEYGTVSLWELSWSNDAEHIYVTANENGRIIRYQDYVSNTDRPAYGNMPRYPKISVEEAQSAAAAFLDSVLDKSLESVALEGNSALDYSGSTVFYLNGALKLNGIESPIGVSVSVNSETKKVTSFYRSDSGLDYGGVTKPSSATDKAAAVTALKSMLNMKLIYALPGDGTHTARLQYQPNPDGSYVVDAATGRLLDLSKLDWSDSRPELYDKAEASASAAPDEAGLTEVEQAAVDKLQGVLSQSALESAVRAYAELGLSSDFILRYLNYYTFQDENEKTQVIATMELRYTPKDDTAQYRYITMDAITGKLISLSSNRLYSDKNGEETAAYHYSAGQTEATARAFAGKILPEELKQTVISADSAGISAQEGTYNFLFNRTHDSISFSENYIQVGVDADTGFVVSFNSSWYDYDVSFVSSSGAISAGAAAEKFSAAVGTTLRYVSVPAATHTSGLLLAYTAGETAVWGVNAITGELLKYGSGADEKLQYSDIDGNPYAAIITRLASYGVGFPGGAFKPDARLTQEDALVLILSAAGRKVIPLSTRPENNDELYSIAYSMGILTPEQKDPAKLITRAELAKYLVNALGYKDVAVLPGIFKAGFKDDTAIPAGLVGYVAIARGVGIIRGDQNGMFRPNDISTRVMAAVMLHNCLSRK
jgi:hypothetical protein